MRINDTSDNSEKKVQDANELPKEVNECDSDDLPDEVGESESDDLPDEIENTENSGLTEEEKAIIKAETGWSDDIINCIESMEQYTIYKNANLHEGEINGRKCLLKDIDLDYVDPKTGLTNRELMAKGRSPIDSKTGEKIELHHMGQNSDAPFAELCENSEHGDGNHKTLHPKTSDSWRQDTDLKNQYQREKHKHWESRAEEGFDETR